MLVDHQIQRALKRGDLEIDPWNPSALQPALVDLTLDRFFRTYDAKNILPIDPRSPVRRTILREVADGDWFVLPSMSFALASTVERVRIPDNMIGRLEGKSSLARMGLFVHVTAGFFDPGFNGFATLELFNAAPCPMKLYPGMPICQMGFDISAEEKDWKAGTGYHAWCPPAEHPYFGKYMNQSQGPQESMYYKNFTDA